VLRTAVACLDEELQRLQGSRLAVIESGNQHALDEHIFKTGELALARGYLNAMAEERAIMPQPRPIGILFKSCG
jgi:hypothetical protein